MEQRNTRSAVRGSRAVSGAIVAGVLVGGPLAIALAAPSLAETGRPAGGSSCPVLLPGCGDGSGADVTPFAAAAVATGPFLGLFGDGDGADAAAD